MARGVYDAYFLRNENSTSILIQRPTRPAPLTTLIPLLARRTLVALQRITVVMTTYWYLVQFPDFQLS